MSRIGPWGSRAGGRAAFRAAGPAPCSRAAGRGSAPTLAAACTGTFSNSYVTTSAPAVSRSSRPDRRRRHDELADVLRARVGRGVEEPEREPERQPCEPEHPPELPAADAANVTHQCCKPLTHAAGSGASSTACVCAVAEGAEPLRERASETREDRRREQRRVDGARLPDRERADRDACRHLDDREQRVHGRRAPSTRPARRGRAASSSPRSSPAGAPRRPRRR